MIPEAAYAMLACTRIGSLHSEVFGWFSPEALAGCIKDCKSKFIITADQGYRLNKTVPLKTNIDAALEKTEGSGIMRMGDDVAFDDSRNIWVKEAPKRPT
uniref:AMP-dependent synthetase/ligase domain-containing protein n=1 Tax=OCS116 cluster bacterium TaxID=2030921 RepID=A0A2A4YZZ2_9PROT